MDPQPAATLGTLLRHLTDLLDGAVAEVYAESGLDYSPRYTPVVRALVELGPAPIRAISVRAGITHSAVSQTVAQMARRRLVTLKAGGDKRERIVSLSAKAKAMLPDLQRHWAATNAAAQAFEAELTRPLSDVLREAIAALEQRPFAGRIDQAAVKRRRESRAKGV
jgi:DNA-binding MarR family transcriptional regulator